MTHHSSTNSKLGDASLATSVPGDPSSPRSNRMFRRGPLRSNLLDWLTNTWQFREYGQIWVGTVAIAMVLIALQGTETFRSLWYLSAGLAPVVALTTSSIFLSNRLKQGVFERLALDRSGAWHWLRREWLAGGVLSLSSAFLIGLALLTVPTFRGFIADFPFWVVLNLSLTLLEAQLWGWLVGARIRSELNAALSAALLMFLSGASSAYVVDQLSPESIRLGGIGDAQAFFASHPIVLAVRGIVALSVASLAARWSINAISSSARAPIDATERWAARPRAESLLSAQVWSKGRYRMLLRQIHSTMSQSPTLFRSAVGMLILGPVSIIAARWLIELLIENNSLSSRRVSELTEVVKLMPGIAIVSVGWFIGWLAGRPENRTIESHLISIGVSVARRARLRMILGGMLSLLSTTLIWLLTLGQDVEGRSTLLAWPALATNWYPVLVNALVYVLAYSMSTQFPRGLVAGLAALTLFPFSLYWCEALAARATLSVYWMNVSALAVFLMGTFWLTRDNLRQGRWIPIANVVALAVLCSCILWGASHLAWRDMQMVSAQSELEASRVAQGHRIRGYIAGDEITPVTQAVLEFAGTSAIGTLRRSAQEWRTLVDQLSEFDQTQAPESNRSSMQHEESRALFLQEVAPAFSRFIRAIQEEPAVSASERSMILWQLLEACRSWNNPAFASVYFELNQALGRALSEEDLDASEIGNWIQKISADAPVTKVTQVAFYYGQQQVPIRARYESGWLLARPSQEAWSIELNCAAPIAVYQTERLLNARLATREELEQEFFSHLQRYRGWNANWYQTVEDMMHWNSLSLLSHRALLASLVVRLDLLKNRSLAASVSEAAERVDFKDALRDPFTGHDLELMVQRGTAAQQEIELWSPGPNLVSGRVTNGNQFEVDWDGVSAGRVYTLSARRNGALGGNFKVQPLLLAPANARSLGLTWRVAVFDMD